MNLTEIMEARRSIRQYLDKPVEEELLTQVLEAGRLAPTARNDQTWYCIVVRNQGLRRQMVAACGDQPMVAEAPVNLVVCGRNDRAMACGQSVNSIDCTIATSFMMLKATELGLGTCWLGRFFPDQVRSLLDIPAQDNVVAVMPLGYANEAPNFRGRKELKEFARMVD